MVIQVRLKDGWKASRIAMEIGCSADTVRNEINRGTGLPEKQKRGTKARRNRRNKRVLGRSIEERSEEVESREEFGHWECDLVIGAKSGGDQVLLTMSERKSREFWMVPIPEKRPGSVMEAVMSIRSSYREHFGEVSRTITTDNGSEFASLMRELPHPADPPDGRGRAYRCANGKPGQIRT